MNGIWCDAGYDIKPTRVREGMVHPEFGEALQVNGADNPRSSSVSVKFENASSTHYFSKLYGRVAVVDPDLADR